MKKLSPLWIILGLLILLLGSIAYMDLVVKKPISVPFAMLFFGICLVVISKLRLSKKQQKLVVHEERT